ncbi:sensory rhodopsin transducer [Conexibacter sp. S30A1]|uniref:sensory rhodopsin transducer n=1 Tax=Conexibacter sp. S30A1 TaxID=2937800 RepID=UPI0035310282
MRWIIPDGWMPTGSSAGIDAHEAVCVVNLATHDAQLTFTFLFEDREPDVVDGLICGARRSRHFRLDWPHELGGYRLAAETPYSLLVESDSPISVQHTRVDTRAGGIALMTTMAGALHRMTL